MSKKVKNTIPVFDIQLVLPDNMAGSSVVAEPFGAYYKKHTKLHVPHRHSFYHVVIFTKGKGEHTIDFERFEVAAGQVYFMKPGQVHSWRFTNDVEGYVINFPEDLFTGFLTDSRYLDSFPFLRGVAADSVMKLEGDVLKEALSIIKLIVIEVGNTKRQHKDIVRAYLLALFVIVNRTVVVAASDSPLQQQVILNDYQRLVEKCFAEKRLPKEYAALLHITPNYLNAICQQLVGKSAGEIIRDWILLEAKRLLVNAKYSMTDIAMQLSFTDSPHFSRFFKKYTNQTPEEFRRNMAGEHKTK